MRKLHCLPVGVLLLTGEGLLALTTDISGRITDQPGVPVSHATIHIRTGNSTSGISADATGAFAFSPLSTTFRQQLNSN